MAYIPNAGAVVPSFTLAADVTNGSTFTFAYPSGFNQGSFLDGLAVPNGSYIVTNGANHISEDVTAATGVAFAFGASLVTVTNNTGATLAAGTKVDVYLNQQDGNNVLDLSFPVDLVGVSAADIVTAFRPGVNGFIESVKFVVNKPVTTAAKLATVGAKINSTAVTGGAAALTSANCTPLGAIVLGSQITALNRITSKDTLSLVASAVTAFAEGTGSIHVRIRKDSL